MWINSKTRSESKNSFFSSFTWCNIRLNYSDRYLQEKRLSKTDYHLRHQDVDSSLAVSAYWQSKTIRRPFANESTNQLSKINQFLANVNSRTRSLYVVANPSVVCLSSVCRLSVVCLSVTFVHPTQPVEFFGNVSTPFGTLAIQLLPRKILRRSSKGNPSVWRVKRKRAIQI